MKIIDERLLQQLGEQARQLPRKRKNLNFHWGDGDLLQRMLNAFEPGTYVRPHRHKDPDKREVFIVLKGRVAMMFFDDTGILSRTVVLSAKDGTYGVEVEPGEWHAVASLEKGSVVYEIKDGPYSPATDKDFAPWAPVEGLPECDGYLHKLLVAANLRVDEK
ncbi:MAG: WbuC family cupin fold metalloprotein [Breznakibacter sp.]